MVKNVTFSDIGYKKSFTDEEKRYAILVLSRVMKEYHKLGYYVKSFDLDKLLANVDGSFDFESIDKLPQDDSKEEYIINNIVALADFYFCSFLSTYDFSNGLLNPKVVFDSFDKFKTLFNQDDIPYLKSALEAYETKKLPETVYYCDYYDKVNGNSTSKGNSMVLKTPASKLYDGKDEAAFGSPFFFVTITVSFVLLSIYIFIMFIR